MGKNYTLYIKDQQFDKETNKSGLVNELLLRHYRGKSGEKPKEIVSPEQKVITEAKKKPTSSYKKTSNWGA
jgi:hypothetical protein